MENGMKKWRIRGNEELSTLATGETVGTMNCALRLTLNPGDNRQVISLGEGDPSSSPCFLTAPAAVTAIIDSLNSASFNGYPILSGHLPARQAIADYLSRDLPYKLSSDDVHLTLGCDQAIQVALNVLANPGANILLPRQCYPNYQSEAPSLNLEVRHFDLLPEKDWEVDLDAVEALADEKTVAIVIVNPGNPCGNVYSYQHLQKVAETASKLRIPVISDEVYGHLTFGSNPFVPMATFGSIVPVLTLGSISKRWIVPGWRLGWLVTADPNGIFKEYGLTECINRHLSSCSHPPTFIQGAIPQILDETKDDFFSRVNEILHRDMDICWELIKDIPCIQSSFKPQGGMFIMVKLDILVLDGIEDDIDFCKKLAKEESILILPGVVVGMKNWLRIFFAVEPELLEEGFGRVKAFYQRHSKKQ